MFAGRICTSSAMWVVLVSLGCLVHAAMPVEKRPPPKVGFGYAAITADDVQAMKFQHYYYTDKNKYQEGNFKISFEKDGFKIEKDKDPISDDLFTRLLPEGEKAVRIEGKWKLDSERQAIVLTDILYNGKKKGRKEVSLHVFRTAPTVIRMTERQYVFARD